MRPYIVVVEDDHLQEEPLREQLSESFVGGTVEIILTEQEFRARLESFRVEPPDIVVLDVMLRWTFPSPDASPPPFDVEKGGYYRAGIRCAELLANDELLSKIPIILLTILERDDLGRDGQHLPDSVTYMRKSADPDFLIKTIRALLESIDRP